MYRLMCCAKNRQQGPTYAIADQKNNIVTLRGTGKLITFYNQYGLDNCQVIRNGRGNIVIKGLSMVTRTRYYRITQEAIELQVVSELGEINSTKLDCDLMKKGY